MPHYRDDWEPIMRLCAEWLDGANELHTSCVNWRDDHEGPFDVCEIARHYKLATLSGDILKWAGKHTELDNGRLWSFQQELANLEAECGRLKGLPTAPDQGTAPGRLMTRLSAAVGFIEQLRNKGTIDKKPTAPAGLGESRYKAPPCPKCSGAARVRSTREHTRYYVCRQCQHTWQESRVNLV